MMGIDIISYNKGSQALRLARKKIEHVIINNDNVLVGNAKILNFSGGLTIEKDSINPDQINIDSIPVQDKCYPVESFTSNVNTNAVSVNYNWKNPNVNNYTKTVLFVSELDITNVTYAECMTNVSGKIFKVKESASKGNTDNATYPTTPLTKYYSKIFVIYTFGTKEYQSIGLTLLTEAKDITPPPTITNLNATQLNINTIKLTWTNPVNPLFKGVSIRRKIGTFATDENDGQEVYKGSDSEYNDNNLEKNKDYYYKIFTYSASNIYNSDAQSQTHLTLDSTPPDTITNAIIVAGFGNIKLKWTGSISTDIKKTVLMKKLGNVGSSTIDDGSLILTVLPKDNNMYQNVYFTDGGLEAGQTYSYTWFVIDNFDNVSVGVTKTETTSTDLIPEVNALKAENLKNGELTNCSWINPNLIPTGLTLTSREIYYTSSMLIDLNTMDRDACNNSAELTKLTEGMGAGIGKAETFPLTVTYGDMVQIKAFCRYDNSGTTIDSTGSMLIHIVKDDTPPSDITELAYVGGDSQVNIDWKNPNDTDFGSVKIYRKLGSYPDGTLDTEKKHESTNQNLNVLNTFIDTGLENGKTYYYLFIIEDANGNQNKNTKFEVTTQALTAFSNEYNLQTDVFTRINLSQGKTRSEIVALAPFVNIRRCVVDDNLNVIYYTDRNNTALKESGEASKLDGTDGQVMVEVPKLWYKQTKKDANTLVTSISATALVGYDVHPAFISNGVTYEKLYLGAFESYHNTVTNKLESRADVIPANNLDVNTMRTLAKARGTKWSIWNRHSRDLCCMLYAILYANGNSQTQIGKGIVNDTAIHKTGETIALGNNDGSSGSATDGKHSINFLGLENFYGNLFQFVDGIVVNDTTLYIADCNYESFISPSSIGSYKVVNGFSPYGGASGFINGMYFTSSYPSMLLANKFTGTDSTFTCDYQLSKQNGGFAYMYNGFKFDSDTKAGMFAVAFVNSGTNSVVKDFVNVAGGLEGTGVLQKVTFNKTTDGTRNEGTQEFTSLSIDDSGATFKLNINYAMANVGTRLMGLK